MPGRARCCELLECSASPVIVSHTACAALQPHGRNLDDAAIRAVAAQGGVVGICGLGLFLGGPPTAARIADHLDHAAQLVGADHLALGLDWFVPGLPDSATGVDEVIAAHPEFWPADQGYDGPIAIAAPSVREGLARDLAGRGWPETAIAAVFGGNMERLAGLVWQAPAGPVGLESRT